MGKKARGRFSPLRLLRVVFYLALGIAGSAAVAFLILTRTHAGQRWIVDLVLRETSGFVHGNVRIGDIRSANLLAGARIHGLSITDPDGRPFLEVDSLDLGYDALGLLRGEIELSSVEVVGARVRIATLPGEARSNVDVLFGSSAPATDPSGAGSESPAADSTDSTSGSGMSVLPVVAPHRIVLRNVRLVDVSVEFLQPVEGEPAPRVILVEGPEGGALRRIAATDIVATLPRIVVSPSESDLVEASVESVGLDAWIFEDPLRINRLRGTFRWSDGVAIVEAEEVSLPASELSGVIRAELDGPRFTLDLDMPGLQLEDVRWLDPRLPVGAAHGGISAVVGPDQIEAVLRDLNVDLGEDHLWIEGGVGLSDSRPSFEDLTVRMEPLGLARVEALAGIDIPTDGRMNGTVTLSGPSTSVRTRGRVVFTPHGEAEGLTTATIDGAIGLGDELRFSGLTVSLDPLDYLTAAKALGDSSGLGGRGRARIELTGALSDGLGMTADLMHSEEGLPTSNAQVTGTVRRDGDDLLLDLDTEVAPLSFTTLRSYRGDLPLSGEVTGSIRASGPLSALQLDARFDTELGGMDLDARVNARRPSDPYQAVVRVVGFPLDRLLPALPEPSVVSGAVVLDGRGFGADSLRGQGSVHLGASVVGGVPVDTVRLDFRVADGRLSFDTLQAGVVGVEFGGQGWLPFDPEQGQGELNVTFAAESLEEFRRWIRGDTVVARDTLSGLQMELLAASGVDTDTLPALEDVAIGGRAEGEMSLRGSFESFDVEGVIGLEELVWGTSRVHSIQLEARASDLPGRDRRVRVLLEADSLDILGRSFRGATAEIDYAAPSGDVGLELVRTADEEYTLHGVATLDSIGGRLDLERLALRFDSVTWTLNDQATISWDESGVDVGNLVVTRPGSDPLRMRAFGRLARTGEADFTLDVDGLPLPRLTGLAQREDLDLQGVADVTLRITGTGRAPVIHGDVNARNLSYETWVLDQLLGSIDYGDERAALDLRAWRGDLPVLIATGTVPVDLSLSGVDDRVPEGRAMDVRVVADSLPAAFAVTLLEDLENVSGTISGDLRIGGTLDAPSPTGTLTLRDGAWTVASLGVRQEDVQGELVLNPDGTIGIDARLRSGGTLQATGSIDVNRLEDPGFDLVLRFDQFQAIRRRDMAGMVSGEVALQGRFREPIVEGLASQGRGLTAVGDLYIEEFARSGLVVDLSDPRFSEFVNQDFLTTAQPIIAASQNPFMNALRVNVDLTVGRDTWLRSGDMNVEIGGNLRMNYNREQRDLVLSGELQAIRGSYTTLGRRFDVQGGTVEFVGTPGVNPNLSIEAVTRVRRPDGDPLDITATLTGTLTDPRVQLSSDEQAIATSDLMSYLAFGRPSYALTSGQAQGVQEASALLDVAGSVGGGFLVGTVTSRISSLLGQRFGLDYFAINPGSVGVSGGASTGAWAQTTVELGGYLGEELFWALTLRPAGLEGSNTLRSLPGVRLEWQATDFYKIEAFIDDRFLRSGAIGFRELGFQPEKIYGLNLFREWTY